MKPRHLILSLSIAAALVAAPTSTLAGSLGDTVIAGVNTAETPRITQTVDDQQMVAIPHTHLALVDQAPSSTPLDGSLAMNHLQLVLTPSEFRHAAMEAFLASQHDPTSPQFDHWLTPQQFGANFGVVDADVAAVTAWLTAQGFIVNSVYPNKLQIDFSGTVAQVNHAFRTRENIYTVGTVKRLANATDIRVPAALQPVVAGVLGLHDSLPTPLAKKPELAQWSASKSGFVPKAGVSSALATGAPPQAVSNSGGVRGLVPDDMATMYGIKKLHSSGITGTGITIAVVEQGDMVPADWTNFVSVFGLARYGGTFQQTNPAPAAGPNNCLDPAATFDPLGVNDFDDYLETVIDAEWATAMAPGANIEVATCSTYTAAFDRTTSNFFGGVYIAAANLVNGNTRPDIISASYAVGEHYSDTESATLTAIDQMWSQADAEGISVFVATGDSGTNPNFNSGVILGAGPDTNALATSTHDTGVGGTDLADILDGTTAKYFAKTPNAASGTALSYVPEIAWNASCGNAVAAKAAGYKSVMTLCQNDYKWDPDGYYATSAAGGGGASSVNTKPSWQSQVYNAAKDQSRDLPDVALFAASYGGNTLAIVCTNANPCASGLTTPVTLLGGTSLSTPMFAGIQALIDQGLQAKGLPKDQGNAAPTLYALAAEEYGGPTHPSRTTLTACNASNVATGAAGCVFHNVTRGSISTQCVQLNAVPFYNPPAAILTPNCYFYDRLGNYFGRLGPGSIGLTTTDASPTSYGTSNEAYAARPGWSFATGLGSVNAANLLASWLTYATVRTSTGGAQ